MHAVCRQYANKMQAVCKQYAGEALGIRQYASNMQAICRQDAEKHAKKHVKEHAEQHAKGLVEIGMGQNLAGFGRSDGMREAVKLQFWVY